MKDIELAQHFPAHIADRKRQRIAVLGALFILFAIVGVPLIILLFLR